MNSDADGQVPFEDLLARPFVSESPGWQHDGAAEPEASEGGHSDIRPYLMTGGRTGPGGMAVAIETVVVSSDFYRRGRPPGQAFERAQILRLCVEPCSVAEVAARLRVPLGVAVVLVSDLIVDGLLDAAEVHRGQAQDVQFLERLIVGVSAL